MIQLQVLRNKNSKVTLYDLPISTFKSRLHCSPTTLMCEDLFPFGKIPVAMNLQGILVSPDHYFVSKQHKQEAGLLRHQFQNDSSLFLVITF